MDVKKKKELHQKNAIISLMNLAGLLDIPLGLGWKKGVAGFFEVKQNLISQWIKNGNIPDARRKFANEKGYPVESWLCEEKKLPEEIEVSLQSDPLDDGTTENVSSEDVSALLPTNINGICERYPEIKYLLMYAGDDNVAEMHRTITAWAGKIGASLVGDVRVAKNA